MFTCVYIYIYIYILFIYILVSDLCGIAIAFKIAHDKAMGAGGARVPVVPDAATCRWESLSERAFNVGKTMTIPQSWLVGGFKHFLFFHILGIIIPTD